MISRIFRRLIGPMVNRFVEHAFQLGKIPCGSLKESLHVLIRISACYLAMILIVFSPLWITVILLSVLCWLVGTYASAIGTLGVGVCLIADSFLDRRREKKVKDAGVSVEAWYALANYLVCPTIESLTKGSVEPEILLYSGQPTFGTGFYFQLPFQIRNKNSELTLLRRLERKYAELKGCDLRQVILEKKIRVTSRAVFIAESL